MEKSHANTELTRLDVSTSDDPTTESTGAADASETPLPNPSPSWSEPARREPTGRRLAAAALATAAVAAAGLASTERVVAGRAVISTDGQAEATAAAMHEAEKNDAALRMAAASAHDNWISIQGESGSVPFGVIAPGGIIRGVDTDGDMARCTITAAVAGGKILTAGHCGRSGTPRFLPDGSTVGVIEWSVDEIPTGGPVVDTAVVKVTVPVTSAAARVADLPIAGVMTLAGVQKLSRGTTVCFDGVTSGVRCAPLSAATSEGLEIDGMAQGGDSGSPVFLVDGDTRAVTLIGVTSGIAMDGSKLLLATYLDPTLTRFGAQVLVDPAASAAVSGDPRYSANVTPLN